MTRCAMLLAAGLGTRMRPLTEKTAKPLLPLGGRTLMDHALDRLAAAGVTRVVVNTHWHGDLVARHLARRRTGLEVVIRPETALLDTGGAVTAALAAGDLGDAPFFVVNGDSFWLDGPTPALDRVAEAFDPAAVDAVLLVHRSFQIHSDVGRGDFAVDPWGGLRRRGEREIVPYIYAGIQLIAPTLFEGLPVEPFSMNRVWDRAIETGRIRAVVHDALWFHLSRPRDLSEAEVALQVRETGETR